jgi:hypothetical protein
MKRIILFLALALAAAACSKDIPNVDTTEQQQLIVGHWLQYKMIDNAGGSVVGEIADTSRNSDVSMRRFLYYSSDGKKYTYDIVDNMYCYMMDTVDYIVTSKGNDILEKVFYEAYPSEEFKIILTENNLNIQYHINTICYIRADWAAEVYARGLPE